MTIDDTSEAAKTAAIIEENNVSPFYKLLGMEIVHVEDGKSRLRLNANPALLQRFDIMHGGAIASLCDSAGGVAVNTTLPAGDRNATIELKVNFLAPARDEVLLAEGRVVSRGRRIMVIEVDVHAEDGRHVAKALGTYIVKRQK